MRVRLGYGLIALAAAAVALTGCTVNGPDPEPTNSTPTTEAESSLNLPQRPSELPIAGKQDSDVCTWLTSEQKAQLEAGGGRPVVKNGNNYNGCTFLGQSGNAQFGITLRIVPEGLAEFSKKLAGAPETIDVNGFGAVQGQIPGAESLGCAVFVDAAEGQTLYVDFGLTSPGALNNQQMCERAKQAAEAAVTALQSS
ncbi:DUF3558 domain-containing protein [Saccharopolyspora sp. K220]|uniref:DUF3558 domain-containing protein n=1 Tax=Saccharopolyspora soli TaxID=2926618 RepID=UPI001F57DF63|nr:DUF3558 domain-containing protein [Saccharopolyspora soli]MCI2419241.1 DUF3558 domain-containing protein [Saccharopolyspora soli]